MPTPPSINACHRACPQCSRPAALGRRFCGGCRAVLIKPCAFCAFGNERDDLWCGGCGAGLDRKAVATPKSPAPRSPAPFAPPARSVPVIPPPRLAAAAPVAAGVADLVAINRRRAPLSEAVDTSDQARLDQLFGEPR